MLIMSKDLDGNEKKEITVPKWDVPRQNHLIENQREDGWCLVDITDPPFGGRVLKFRKAAAE